MTHQEHIDSITASFKELATDKYFKGAKEHGGNLWDKQGLIDMAIEEAIDQVIYLMTLKQQIDDSNHIYGIEWTLIKGVFKFVSHLMN